MKVKIGKYPKSCFKKRKVDVRIDPHDTYSMDHTLSFIILPMLKQLKKSKHGVPGSMEAFKEGYYDWKADREKAQDQLNRASKQWDDILDKMINAFKVISKQEIDAENRPDVKEGLKLFAEHYFSLWD